MLQGPLQQALASEQLVLTAAQAEVQNQVEALAELARQAPSAAIARKRTALRAHMAATQARVSKSEECLRKYRDKLAPVERALRQADSASSELTDVQIATPPAVPIARPLVTSAPMQAQATPPEAPTSGKTQTDKAWIQRLLGDQAGGYGGRVGPYRVERLLGSGSQATVFLAADAIRQVALKVIDANQVDSATWGALRKEARRLASIRHEHVVLVHGFDEVSLVAEAGEDARRVAYISLEYMSGGTLIDLEASEAGKGCLLPPPRAFEACLAAARGLVAIHAAGFVHCDIKPHNILTDGRACFRVGDLGVAADIGWDQTKASGTLAYLSPEIITAHHERSPHYPIAPACDIYSLGATLYRLLTGQAPIAALAKNLSESSGRSGPITAWEAFSAYKALPDPRAFQPELPTAVANVVLTATAFDPQARYASAEEFVDALAEAISTLRNSGGDSGKRKRWLW